MKTIRFTVPAELVLSLNRTQRMHWAARGRKQEDMDNLVYYEIRSCFKSAVPQYQKVRVKMTLFSRHVMDCDNILGGTGKHLHDAIVKTELVPDDKPDYMTMEKPEFEYHKDLREIHVEIICEGEPK